MEREGGRKLDRQGVRSGATITFCISRQRSRTWLIRNGVDSDGDGDGGGFPRAENYSPSGLQSAGERMFSFHK